MKATSGENVEVMMDSTGGIIHFDWCCPYCDNDNIDKTFSDNVAALSGRFALDRECEWCHKMVTVQCSDITRI